MKLEEISKNLKEEQLDNLTMTAIRLLLNRMELRLRPMIEAKSCKEKEKE